ncbi:hypothetical protein MTP99_007258 [Tenebrio molitor]|nr:hypothetical protein MTP99_007258 [Tenebrio molitor]
MAAEVETSWIPRASNGDPVNNRRSGNSACLFPAISYLQHGERSFLRRFLPTYMHAAWSNQRNYTPCRTTCYGERRHRAFLPGCAFFARRTIEKHSWRCFCGKNNAAAAGVRGGRTNLHASVVFRSGRST